MESDALHYDRFGRGTKVPRDEYAQERYLRPIDGRLAPLVVQGTSDGSFEPGGSEKSGTWKRRGPAPMRVSLIIRLVSWTYSSMEVLKWVPSCLLLLFLLFVPQNLEGNLRNSGNYDPVCAFDDQYPMVARNNKERRGDDDDANVGGEPDEEDALLSTEGFEMTPMASRALTVSATSTASPDGIDDDFDDLPSRHFGPRWLCFLDYDSTGQAVGYETRLVADWIKEHGDNADTDFVFVSYTRKQFCVATPQELAKWDVDPATREALVHIAQVDRDTLIQYGIEAARSAGKKAFWLDYECIRDADGLSKATSQSTDVYRICDIIRAAHSMVILIGPSVESKKPGASLETYNPEAMLRWLQEWGTRLWTLPEILLVSPERRVKIYAIGEPTPTEWSKRHFASRSVWSDAKLVRQLIDHYESSIHLQPLELVSIALDCFTRRHTDQFNSGDIVYALMGLLRRRPAVDTSDTSFVAFARLSLANDSSALLERLICLQPSRQDLPWYDQSDFWAAKLWDIEPRCQIAGIVDDETVVLDGAFGATIQWDTTEQIYFFKRPTLLRTFGKILLRGVPLYMITGLATTITAAVIINKYKQTLADIENKSSSGLTSSPEKDKEIAEAGIQQMTPALAMGLVFLVPAIIITLFIPALLRNIYLGKFWTTQALFVGLEGVPSDLGFVEKRLFGSNGNRLRWSAAGSALSQHALRDGKCVGLPPLLEAPGHGAGDEGCEIAPPLPVFTLVDTYAMTAMAFRAARPPSAVVICGQEGGMQRAALCSYDWSRNAFAREQVVRLKTTVLDRMPRMDRFRFSLKRRSPPSRVAGPLEDAQLDETRSNLTPGPAKRKSLWTRDLVIIPFMFFLLPAVERLHVNEPLFQILYYTGFFLGSMIVAYWPTKISIIMGSACLTHSTLGVIIGCWQLATSFDPTSAGWLAVAPFGGIASGAALSSFIFLTCAWYGASPSGAFWLLVWSCGSLVLGSLSTEFGRDYKPINTTTPSPEPDLAWAILGLLLSLYALKALGTPDEVHWAQPQQKSWALALRSGLQHQRAPKASRWATLYSWRQPKTWFFCFSSFLTACLCAVPLSLEESSEEVFGKGDYAQLYFLILGAFPTALLLSFGYIFKKFHLLRLPIITLFLAATFVGHISILKLRMVIPLLGGISHVTQSLIWALIITESQMPTRHIDILTAAMGGYAIGNITTRVFVYYRRYGSFDSFVFFSVVFGLAVSLFFAWSIFSWMGRRRQSHANGTVL